MTKTLDYNKALRLRIRLRRAEDRFNRIERTPQSRFWARAWYLAIVHNYAKGDFS